MSQFYITRTSYLQLVPCTPIFMASEPNVPDIQLQAQTGSVDAIPLPRTPPPGSASGAKPLPQAPMKGTPVKQKATNSETYASGLEGKPKRNVDLAHETKGHFLGIMPPADFLDRYLPLNSAHGPAPSKRDLRKKGAIAKIPSKPTSPSMVESKMYIPFINAINPHLEGMVLVDTHARGDAHRDHLAPDVALYPDNVQTYGNITYFPAMSSFIEFKASATDDPFEDHSEPSSSPADVCFEREEEVKHNRGQISKYSAAISGTQFRTHVFSVSVCGQFARFILWDRSGALVTAKFDYLKKPHLLVGFFYRYSRLTREQQGYDPTASEGPAPERELAVLPSNLMEHMQKANKHHREFRRLMVPDRDDPSPEKEKPFLISYPPFYETRSPFSRATRAMLAFDLTEKRLVFLKDYWRANVDRMEKEGEIYRILQAKNVPHIAPFGMGNDVRNQETQTQEWRNQRPRLTWLFRTSRQICLRHYRMTLDVVGRNLTEFHSSRQLVSAIADAMEAHDAAFFDCKVLHRDISVGNILLMDDNKGLLIDWDLCIKLDDDNDKPVARRPNRTGTWQFMSVKLLDDSSIRHSHHDDRESAFYVLLWTALRYTKTKAVPGTRYTPQVILHAFDEARDGGGGRKIGGSEKEILLSNYKKKGIVFTERPELDSLMAELAPVFHVRYEAELTAEQMARFKQVVKKFEDANSKEEKQEAQEAINDSVAYGYQQRMDKLEMKGWLVDTIRKYLAMGEWPTDASCVQVTVSNSNKRKATEGQRELDSRVTKKRSTVDESSKQSSQSSLHSGQPSSPSSRSSEHSSHSSEHSNHSSEHSSRSSEHSSRSSSPQ
ncbi:hypothetical protein BJ912DRAFT_230456 [Pholiota molesta]|nr:hypothetical protein BJ912DRAFT_230456 [Pholiota molesta]